MTKASRAMLALLFSLPLAGCETAHYSTQTLGPDEYLVTVRPPGGIIAGVLDLPLSKATLRKVAAEQCPSGYDKLVEEHGYAESEFIRWEIRCQV